ncbi:uncharacterized protein LOC141974063 [Athene noctua]|uniref:uncharacterized protein LOC141974063 n=1 Tax=Athene noctua TaxID=126797 RepID=UPI003EB6C9A7
MFSPPPRNNPPCLRGTEEAERETAPRTAARGGKPSPARKSHSLQQEEPLPSAASQPSSAEDEGAAGIASLRPCAAPAADPALEADPVQLPPGGSRDRRQNNCEASSLRAERPSGRQPEAGGRGEAASGARLTRARAARRLQTTCHLALGKAPPGGGCSRRGEPGDTGPRGNGGGPRQRHRRERGREGPHLRRVSPPFRREPGGSRRWGRGRRPGRAGGREPRRRAAVFQPRGGRSCRRSPAVRAEPAAWSPGRPPRGRRGLRGGRPRREQRGPPPLQRPPGPGGRRRPGGAPRGKGPEPPATPSSCRSSPALRRGNAGRLPPGCRTEERGPGRGLPGSLPNAAPRSPLRLAWLCPGAPSAAQNRLSGKPAGAPLSAALPGRPSRRTPLSLGTLLPKESPLAWLVLPPAPSPSATWPSRMSVRVLPGDAALKRGLC